MICSFFGHRDAPQGIEDKLRAILTDLIENKGVDMFYVGNQGDFDHTVKKVLKELRVKYYVVLAYMPTKTVEIAEYDHSDTIYPDGLESTPPKFAISKRNRWMIEKADFVITYVTRSFGGAAQFKAVAERKGKQVIELSTF